MYIPTCKSYFSGGGLSDLGLSMAGVNIIQSLEIDRASCDTLRRNFSHKVVEKDIKDILVTKQDSSDFIMGTYPCTKYSRIADIHGTRTGDELFLHFFRHIAIEQPEMYAIENVVGMKAFPVVMEAMSKLPGYYISVFCPLNATVWLPQKRQRLILFATKRPFSISEPVPMIRRPKLSDLIDSNPEVEIPSYVMKRINGGYRDKPIISDPSNPHELAPTAVSHFSKDRGTRLVVDKTHPNGVRPYSMREYARLQGVPDSYQFEGGDNEAIKQIGNGVPVPMAEWIGQQVMRYFNN